MYCKYCGNKIPDGSDRCPSCGYTVEEEPKRDESEADRRPDEPYEPEVYDDTEERETTEERTDETYVPFKPLSTKEYFQTVYDRKSVLFVHVSFWIAILIGGFFIFWTIFSWLRAGRSLCWRPRLP